MKKILLLIYVCVILIFTACSENSDTTAANTSIDETKLTEQSTTVEAEMSDEEYLINLGKRLKVGMTEQEVIDEIGEPDKIFDGGLSYIAYLRGDCELEISTYGRNGESIVFFIRVLNHEPDGKITIIDKMDYEEYKGTTNDN